MQCVYVSRSSRPELFCKKCVLRNFAKFTGKHLCQSLFLIKLQASEFCEISKSIFFTEHLWASTSDFEVFMVDFFNIPSSFNKIKD